MKTDCFQSCGHRSVFQICWHIECSSFIASSFWIWNSSTGIPLPSLALFVVVLPKAQLTLLAFQDDWLSVSDHTIVVIWVMNIFFLYSSVYSCHLLLISSVSLRSITFLSFIVPIFAWNIPLVSLIFLNRTLVFSCYCFPLLVCIDRWGRLSYLSMLFFGTLHLDGYIFLFLLCLFLLLFSPICKPPQTSIFAFLFLGDGLDHRLLYNVMNIRP